MMFDTTKRVFSDISTSKNGDYDPARILGYAIPTLGALVFFGLTIYTTLLSGKFDGSSFAVGLVSITAAIVGAAGGVLLKSSTEIDPATVAVPPAPTIPPVIPPTQMPYTPPPGQMPYPAPSMPPGMPVVTPPVPPAA